MEVETLERAAAPERFNGNGADADDAAPAPRPTLTERLATRFDQTQTWVLLAPVIALAVGGWSHRWITDDAFINFRVVDVTLRGHPFAFNAAERVEAGTSPLWVALLTLLRVSLGWFVELPWLAVVAGLALTIFGLAAAMAASVIVVRRSEQEGTRPSLLFPAGALVLCVLPPMWDFATSGLETGLSLGWIGGCYLFLAHRYVADDRDRSPASPWWGAVLVGLGPLIRPDMAVFSLAFIVVLLVLSRAGRRSRLASVGIAAAAPVAFEVFRMGYFANLVPNTALTKEAGEANFAKGMAYLDNLMNPYALLVPGALLVMWAVTWFLSARPEHPGRYAVLLGVPVIAALVHGLYIVRVGGDFMHGRLLLPAAFAIFGVIAVLPVSRERYGRGLTMCVAVLTGWAVVCASDLRVPERDQRPPRWSDILDERVAYTSLTGKKHPITLEDYGEGFTGRGNQAKELAEKREDVLVLLSGDTVPLAPGSGVVLEGNTLGAVSYAAGPDVRVLDVLGLANAIGSRIKADRSARQGHQKNGDRSWGFARLDLVPGSLAAANERATKAAKDAGNKPVLPAPDLAVLDAAQQAVQCPAARALLDATEEPLTPARILSNIVQAPRLTRLRFPRHPKDAADCRRMR
jgi:arabinofuranosyltransferase